MADRNKNPTDPLSVINATGFPFQLAVEHELTTKSAPNSVDNLIIVSEYRWQDATTDGYVDLIVEREHKRLRFVIECKRVEDREWYFIRYRQDQLRADKFIFPYWAYDSHRRERRAGYKPLQVELPTMSSFQSVLDKKSTGGAATIDGFCSELLRATEAIVTEHMGRDGQTPTGYMIYVPVIVTTAKLVLCHFEPSNIQLANGRIDNPRLFKSETVEYLQYKKSLYSQFNFYPDREEALSLNRMTMSQERSVYVVNAASISSFMMSVDAKFADIQGLFRVGPA